MLDYTVKIVAVAELPDERLATSFTRWLEYVLIVLMGCFELGYGIQQLCNQPLPSIKFDVVAIIAAGIAVIVVYLLKRDCNE